MSSQTSQRSTVRSRRLTRATAGLCVSATALVVLAGCGGTAESASDDPSPSRSSDAAPDPSTAAPAGETSSEPASPPSGAPDGQQQIPDDFPLASDLPRTNGDDGSPVRVTDTSGLAPLELCGETVWSPTAPETAVDVAGTTYTGEAEDVRARTLALYPDKDAAIVALARARDAITACPAASIGGTDQVYEEYEGDANSAFITHRYRTEGNFDVGLEVLQLVRVGNALYLAAYYGEGGGSPASIASSVDFARESSARVVSAMSTFDV